MEKKIFINDIECKEFKKFDSVVLNDLEREVNIVGGNGEGKSSILNAISWALMGLDIYGNRIEPMKEGSIMSWVKLDLDVDGDEKSIRKIINLKKNGKTETTTNLGLELDKEIFYSIANPRYLQGLDPRNIKGVLAKVINIPTNIMELSMDTTVVAHAKDIEGSDSKDKILAVEAAIKSTNAEIKEIEKKILMEKGKIEGFATIKVLLSENGISIPEDAETIMDVNTDNAQSAIALYQEEIKEKKEVVSNLNNYRTSAYEVLATEFNGSMKKTQIKLLENGKEVFIITYDGKNIKSCSNSEQLLAGLEMVNSISEFTDCSYPCLIDNAECILDIDTDDYPHIGQFVFAIVADEKLSTWEDGLLTDITTKAITPRTREQLKPTVKILDGWGSKKK